MQYRYTSKPTDPCMLQKTKGNIFIHMYTEKIPLSCGALFSGIGGFCLGFEAAGFQTLWATDFDNQVTNTYNYNFPKTYFIQEDICSLDLDKLEPVDIIHAGFPCQSFSQAGGRLGFNDPRGELFNVMMDKIIASPWKPKVLVFENSPYLKSGGNGDWFNRIKFRIKKAGYWFDDQNTFVLSTKKLVGLPQKRDRLFMVATNKLFFGFNPFCGIKNSPTLRKNCELLDLNSEHDMRYYLPENNRYGKWILSEGKKLETGQLIQLRKNVLRPQAIDECPTLTANMGLGGHNIPFLVQNGRLRKMTERECLRMQGFPESFKFPEMASSAQYRMIGNSVSPEISQMLADVIFKEIYSQQEFLERAG